MYTKYADYTGQKDVHVLMSKDEFLNGGGNLLRNVPITITPDGNEPIEVEEEIQNMEAQTIPSLEDRVTNVEIEQAEIIQILGEGVK